MQVDPLALALGRAVSILGSVQLGEAEVPSQAHGHDWGGGGTGGVGRTG